jgi:osmotically-inducible protein OsmY
MKTDAQVQQDVLAELKWEPSIHAAQIGVEVKDGIVTLAGRVNSFAEKWDAERVAQRVAGVKAIAVEIEVHLPGNNERNDADIAGAVKNALYWQMHVPKDAVKVMVEKGYVTLSGELNWEYQREAAVAAVRYLMGVTGVSNQLAVKPDVSLSAIKADIVAALKRRAHTDAAKITVTVDGPDVTLSGSVPSWSERTLARDSAWNSPGVRFVVDNMTVT